ncbi:hypothetical protein [Pseudomonas sp. PvP001]|uniref:hypothetical protein n=1 Tax=Pseudomonas sp. PvP001 TaxID=3158559 RepID=UPI0033920D9C
MKHSYKERQHALRSWNIHSLPETPFAFARFFVGHFRGWYLAILLLQVVAVICTVLVPWVLGQITRVVSTASADNLNWQTLSKPLLLFAGLLVLEVLCTRGATGAHIRVLPLQRRTVTHPAAAFPSLRQQRIRRRPGAQDLRSLHGRGPGAGAVAVRPDSAAGHPDPGRGGIGHSVGLAGVVHARPGRWGSSPSAISWPNAVTRCPSNTRRRAAPATARWWMRCPT